MIMIKLCFFLFLGILLVSGVVSAQQSFPTDRIGTDSGPIEITMIGHATLMLQFQDKVIHIDPWTRLADYTKLPKADLILITHGHSDHLDPQAISEIRKEKTRIVAPKCCSDAIAGATMMENGATEEISGFTIEAVPAYNIVNMRSENKPYHPKGEGNGYVIRLGGKRVYVAGDTENTPEMKALKNIEAAFLPMNLPYTMSPEMVVDAARAFKPRVLYPYHYGQENITEMAGLLKTEITEMMKDEKAVEVRFPAAK